MKENAWSIDERSGLLLGARAHDAKLKGLNMVYGSTCTLDFLRLDGTSVQLRFEHIHETQICSLTSFDIGTNLCVWKVSEAPEQAWKVLLRHYSDRDRPAMARTIIARAPGSYLLHADFAVGGELAVVFDRLRIFDEDEADDYGIGAADAT